MYFLCFVRGIIIATFFVCITLLSVAQSSSIFFNKTEKALAASEQQWICRELVQRNPSYFSKNLPKHVYFKPSEFERVLPGSAVDSSTQQRFHQLLFPSTQQSQRFLLIKAASDVYFPLFDKFLMQYKLPRELKFISVMCSGINQTYTSDDGRAGLWGMDYFAARSYGLHVDEFVDERKGGDFTSQAAVRYLSDLYSQFNGQIAPVLVAWSQSMAAARYAFPNDSLQHARLNENQKLLLGFYSYSVLQFQHQSTEHQLNAAFDVYGEYEQVWVEQNCSFKGLCEVLNLPPLQVRAWNPVYTGEKISGTYRRVPLMLDKVSASRWPQLKDSVYHWMPPSSLISSAATISDERSKEVIVHTVKRGETLGTIAARYHVSTANLKKWNRLRKDTIRAGQRLRIEKKSKSSNAVKPAEQPKTEVAPAPPGANVPSPKPKEKPKEDYITYTVRSGDSLWKIARKYKVSERQIKQWNKCGDQLQPGQKLKIKKR